MQNRQPRLVTDGLPGTGGTIKAIPEHFVVVERPLYEPSGEGEHLYVRIRRRLHTTREMQRTLARLFRLPEMDVSYAGMKDKIAVAEQTFSLRNSKLVPEEVVRTIEGETDWQVLWTKRHGNKLRLGHLLGNGFTILLTDACADAAARAAEVIKKLRATGIANYFGPQRFGGDGGNADLGREVLAGRGPRQPWLRRLAVSSLQSELFNAWLEARLEQGLFGKILVGDIAKKTDTGGLFDVADPVTDQERFDRREITYTGPMFGPSMRPAHGDAGAIEESILAAKCIDPAAFGRVRVEGTRRPAVLFSGPIEVQEVDGGLRFTFDLPKGAYATTVLSEITKSTIVGAEMDEE